MEPANSSGPGDIGSEATGPGRAIKAGPRSRLSVPGELPRNQEAGKAFLKILKSTIKKSGQ